MDSRKKLGILIGALCAVIGLMIFLQSSESIPSKTAAPAIDSFEPTPRVTFVVTGAVEQLAKERIETTPSSGEELAQKADVYGVVRDEKGKPVKGAEVHAIQEKIGVTQYDASAITTEDGKYEIDGLHLHNPYPYKIIASAPGYAPTPSNPFLFDSVPKEVSITLTRGAALSGRVTTTFGGGIEGVTLTLAEYSRAVSPHEIPFLERADGVRTAKTDAEGDYAFRRIPPEEYCLYLHADGYVDKGRNLTISTENSDSEVDFVMNLAGEEYCAGVVVDTDGAPVAGAKISIAQRSLGKFRNESVTRLTHSSSNGAFRLEGFSSEQGRFMLGVSKEGYNPGYRSVDKENIHDLEIRLRLRNVSVENISGRVVESRSNRPIHRFHISILRGDDYMSSHHGYRRSVFSQSFDSPDGSFTISDLQTGGLFFRIRANGYSTRTVYVNPYFEGSSPSLEIALELESVVTGVVYDLYTRDPIPGARVYVEQQPVQWRRPLPVGVIADESGSYRFAGLPPGPLRIFASNSGYASTVSKEIQLFEGKPYEGLDFFLGTGGSIGGAVTGLTGPVSNARVSLRPIASYRLMTRLNGAPINGYLGPRSSTKTDENGYYRKDGMSAGYYQVTTAIFTGDDENPEYVSNNEIVQIHEGKTTYHNITFCEGGTVKAVVFLDKSYAKRYPLIYIYLRPHGAPLIAMDEEGEPILEAPIRMDVTQGNQSEWHSDLPHICPGRYTVTAWVGEPVSKGPNKSGYDILGQMSTPVTIRSNQTVELTFDFRK